MTLIEALASVDVKETSCRHNCAESVKIAVGRAGYDNSIFSVSCTQTRQNLLKSDSWKPVEINDSKPNDIILFDWYKTDRDENHTNCEHIGIVNHVENGIIYYDDFNGGDCNRTYGHHQIALNSTKIVIVFRAIDQVQEYSCYKDKYVILHKYDRGSIVKVFQALLNVDVDGDFGDETTNAVREFQKKHSLEVDGVIGDETLTKISEVIKDGIY